MLELKNIHKNYDAGVNEVRALQGIDLKFRKNEFVAILGPSGCGKTTMLNLIGGLDQYTKGELIINGRSTKDYKDRDWDAYRNHSVGFVFQSYNLIPHQNVLSNVELALTLSGVGKKERRRRAKAALEQVGLGDQLRKKPSQMSGGQMQRVAIARALVNDPDIILADEPTGALDTQTSIQVMEILKEVAKDRLVVMVTHNPELAQTYATRTIRMLDGKITDDSAPLSDEEVAALQQEDEKTVHLKIRKPSMSLFTSFSLSLKNLITKKGRTTLTAFAGSIGIIGIALIFAVSQGTSNYIQAVQEETLSSYPLTLSATTMDVSTLMSTFMDKETQKNEAHELDGIYSKSMLADMVNAMNSLETTENDLASFKAFMEQDLNDPDSTSGLKDALSGVQYTYDFDLQVYTKGVDGKVVYSDTQSLLMDAIKNNMGMDMSAMLAMREQMSGSAQMMNTRMQLWNQMLSGMDGSLISPVLQNQYDVVKGRWPAAYNEIVLVVDENHELDDLTLYALGLISREEINAVFDAAMDGTSVDNTQKKWSYEQILDTKFRVVLTPDCFVKDENSGLYMDLRETDAGLRYLYDNGIDLKITGIICLKEDAGNGMLKGAIGYTVALTEYLIENSQDSKAISDQLENSQKDIFSGKPFKENTGNLTAEEKKEQFIHYVDSLSIAMQAETYLQILSVPDPQTLQAQLDAIMAQVNREDMEIVMVQAICQQMGISTSEAEGYAESMSDEELQQLYQEMAVMQIRAQQEAAVRRQFSGVPEAQLAAMLQNAMESYTLEAFALYYDEVTDFSDSSLEENLQILGYADLADPASINLYANSFQHKDVIEAFIADYNQKMPELQKIRYTDVVGIMIAAVTTIIDAITYVLIAFVAISLVVSSIMIGVITLISVQERTKEIGILRAIGASKGNVSSMFTAETVLIGLAAGILGVGVTYLACIPINAIVKNLTGLSQLKAHLPGNVAVVLVLISVLLTLISGIIPSRSAAKKDPVVALRTE